VQILPGGEGIKIWVALGEPEGFSPEIFRLRAHFQMGH
jgi:hypothetical protein